MVAFSYVCVLFAYVWYVCLVAFEKMKEMKTKTCCFIVAAPWLRTNGSTLIGAAAKVVYFDRLGKRYALALLGR